MWKMRREEGGCEHACICVCVCVCVCIGDYVKGTESSSSMVASQ